MNMPAKIFATVATLGILTLASCSSDQDALLIPVERTDISITGDMQLESFQQDNQTTDLVSYGYYGYPANRIDYIVQLSPNLRLIIKVVDEINLNPWEQVGQPYNIYPSQELEDKQQYTTVEIRTSSNEPRYTSNDGSAHPPGALLDVFKVVENDGHFMRCRIRDMELFHQVQPERTVRINGTFVGAITF